MIASQEGRSGIHHSRGSGVALDRNVSTLNPGYISLSPPKKYLTADALPTETANMVRLRVVVILLTIFTGAVSLLSPGTGDVPPRPDYLPQPDPYPPPKPQRVAPPPPQGGSLLPALGAPSSSLLPLAHSNPATLPHGAASVNAHLAPVITAPFNARLSAGIGAPHPRQQPPHQPPPGALVPYLLPGGAPLYTPNPAAGFPLKANIHYLHPGAAPPNPVLSLGQPLQILPPGSASFLPPGAAPLLPPPSQYQPYPGPPYIIPPQYWRGYPQSAGSPLQGQNTPTTPNQIPPLKGNMVLPINWQLLNSPANQVQARPTAAYYPTGPNLPSRPPVLLGRRSSFSGPPFFSRIPSRPSRFMVLLDFLWGLRAAKEMDCKTVAERLNLPRYYPISCDNKCLPSTFCRNVGPIGFCCPL
ncbi:vegetative cell wall protein gp1-like [Haliotis rufescens]|uniref:vegetative cell wall protein gp1-like n=1 Tax=Haliotis rufescens TaxID=6454 RepID=UPI00201F3F05|nr:vegetative cell wall protein gp1-like [Haliotis rufescens]